MKQKKILSVLGQVDEKYIEEATPAKFMMENSAIIHPFKVRGKIKTALIAAVLIALACTTVATAAYLYQVYIANRDTALPSYEITAELDIQTVSSDALKELSQTPYQTYKTSYAEVENFLDVDLLISNRLDSAVLGEGVDIQGSYAKGERPITSITLFSRHDTGATMSGYIDMTVYMSIGTKKPYEQITQILNPELLEKDAILSEYVSAVNGIDAKFAVYETVGYTAVDLRQLLRGKKGTAGNEAGASGKVPLGGGIAVCAALGTVIVALIQSGVVPHPFPRNELNSVLGGVARQDRIIKLSQRPVVSCQTAGRQLRRRLHLTHIL